jgi:hypothetical protein
MNNITITSALLRKHGACRDEVARFAEQYPCISRSTMSSGQRVCCHEPEHAPLRALAPSTSSIYGMHPKWCEII